MIKEEFVTINGHSSNIKFYKGLGYNIENRKPILVKTSHLMRGSVVRVTTICDNCFVEKTNLFKDYWNYTDGLIYPYYCNSCKKIKSEKTSLENWGTKNPMQSEEIKERLKNSLLDKYGVDHFSKTKEWLVKFKKTSFENWGVDNPSKSPVVIDRIKESNNLKFGTDWVMQNSSNIEKSKNKFKEKWCVDWISKTDYCKNKVKKTSQLKWGVDNFMQTNECKKIIKETNESRWGGHPSKLESFKLKSKLTKERKTLKRYFELIGENYKILNYQNEEFHLIHKEKLCEFKINKGLLLARLNLGKMICAKCNPISIHYSYFELEVCKFLDEIGVEYIRNDRRLLGGTELDILINDHKIAIECNGLYWHSELFKSKNYHINKTLSCLEEGINLIHIWEDDWDKKKDIVKSILRNRVKKTEHKIFARKCEIKEVSTLEYRKFLDDNHIQGFAASSYNIGLYFNGELVSLMTFGFRRTNSKREFELIRFCNKLNTNVIGSSFKLFKYFLKNNCIECITSYSDISIFNGNMYSLLGFKKIDLSSPNYFWVVNSVRKHRYNFSKRKLVKLGYDELKTEVEIMNERGYFRIFSTGQVKWMYDKNESK